MTQDETLPAGRSVGRYQLVRRLGRGGFGEVYLGEDPQGRPAAVKLLHATLAEDPEIRRRFAAEVEQARRISGFCIAAILDADPNAAEPWIASEYIDGPTLHDSVRTHGPRHGADLLRLAVSTATALTAIHAAGVIHRDLKPENIMLAADGPRVIDFGIARAVEATSVTASGQVGTIGYMAPEQLEGERLSAAVDIFAWGAVMVYAANGSEAFPAPSQAARIRRILTDDAETGVLGGPLLSIVRACLAKDPRDRPSARDLLDRLVALPGDGASAPPPPDGDGAGAAADAEDHDPTAPDGTRTEAPTAFRTRVEEHDRSPSGGTLPYTRRAGADAGHPAPPPDTARPGGARTGTGGVPPHLFAGAVHTDPGQLAEAMQRNWDLAARVFVDAEQRAALAAWMIDDVGDTMVERSVLRRSARDADQAVAWFIAQLRPDLPPVYRGRDASVQSLQKMFADPAAATGATPLASELALFARPEVLDLMARHDGPDSGAHRELATGLQNAQAAASGFLNELRAGVPGLGGRQLAANPALALVFLLHPEQIVPPDAAGDSRAAEWFTTLWQRVDRAEGPERAGLAAAVYALRDVVRERAVQERQWQEAWATAQTELDRARRRLDTARYLRWAPRGALVLGVLLGGMSIWARSEPVATIGVLLVVGGGVVRMLFGGWYQGFPSRVDAAQARVQQLEQHQAQVQHVAEAASADLAHARDICAGAQAAALPAPPPPTVPPTG